MNNHYVQTNKNLILLQVHVVLYNFLFSKFRIMINLVNFIFIGW